MTIQDRLQQAIHLRETGRAEEARALLLELVASAPDDAQVNYQAAWVHDNLGLEREAIPFYVQAIEKGLSGADLEGALLGLGSTYRALGEYARAIEIFKRGIKEFPHNRALSVFLALALYNTQQYSESVELLLTHLAETTTDENLVRYKRALLFYASQLGKTWD